MQKNRFAAAMDDDSDEVVEKQTKTQKKKEERKIEPVQKPVKVNINKMQDGGFDVVTKDRDPGGQRGKSGLDAPKWSGRGDNRFHKDN